MKFHKSEHMLDGTLTLIRIMEQNLIFRYFKRNKQMKNYRLFSDILYLSD